MRFPQALALLLVLVVSCDNPRRELALRGKEFSVKHFVETAQRGDLDGFLLFLRAGMSPETVAGNDGMTILMLVAKLGEAKMLRGFPPERFGIHPPKRWSVAYPFTTNTSYWWEYVSFSTLREPPEGELLYGVEIVVHPNYRGMQIGQRLYEARKDLAGRLNLAAVYAGGRIPGYHKYAEEMPPGEYAERVERGELRDPVLSFQLRNGFVIKATLSDYLVGDAESLNMRSSLSGEIPIGAGTSSISGRSIGLVSAVAK